MLVKLQGDVIAVNVHGVKLGIKIHSFFLKDTVRFEYFIFPLPSEQYINTLLGYPFGFDMLIRLSVLAIPTVYIGRCSSCPKTGKIRSFNSLILLNMQIRYIEYNITNIY